MIAPNVTDGRATAPSERTYRGSSRAASAKVAAALIHGSISAPSFDGPEAKLSGDRMQNMLVVQSMRLGIGFRLWKGRYRERNDQPNVRDGSKASLWERPMLAESGRSAHEVA
jgi:hypothetical protein